MTIQIPQSAQGAFVGSMETGQKIELPFPAPSFYILNGAPQFEELKNVMYFGGWAAADMNIKAAAEQWENCPFPIPSFTQKDLRPKGSAVVPSHVARSLIVAPIGAREFSTVLDESTGQTKRLPPFTKGARPNIQVLVYLAYLGEDKKSIHSWAPAMLTARGYQVNHVKKAFAEWRKAILPHMEEIAPGATSDVTALFWMNIGTFGAELVQEQHGQSAITPVRAFIPDDLTAAQVQGRYVGYEVAEFMAGLSAKARDWLKAYQKPASGSASSASGEPEYVTDEPPPPDDDQIPF